MSQRQGGPAFPVEAFVQALSAQLDRAQDALALKAKTGRPLTFALKDLSVDLKVFWESQQDGRLLLRHAAPNEEGASTVHLSFTTITREMVQENTISLSAEDDPRTLETVAGRDLDEADRRKLEMVGVRTVGQLKKLAEGSDPRHMGALLDIPINRLQSALEQSARPMVSGTQSVAQPHGRALLKIQGANLENGERPRVRLDGEPVEVIESSKHEVLVRPMAHHRAGQLEIHVGSERAEGFYELPVPPYGPGGSG